jgi:(p)ppGpp synthase/HD superfamily hydrolase
MPESSRSNRFRDALILAFSLHHAQIRKGTNVPYISHLLGFAAIVIEDGGNETEAIAALLHDAAEDQGGLPVLEKIRDQFVESVAFIVERCSDTFACPRPPWEQRKQQYLQRLETAPLDVLRASMADKLHNLRTLILDYRHIG